MESDTKIPSKLSDMLDGFVICLGHAVSWLNAVLVVVIIIQVILRYVFGRGIVMLEELQWHLYSVGIMIGLSYATAVDSHIRLDILSTRFSNKRKEIFEILGILLLLMPMAIVVFLHGYDLWHESWRMNESSDAPLGLPYRWIIKGFLPLSFVLLFMTGVSRLVRAIGFLRKG